MEERELVIIGGGPAGYVAAIRAARLGGKVTLVEADRLGGTCLNRGCIPSKSLLHGVELYEAVRDAAQYGINASGVSYDLAKMMARKSTVVSTLVSGVQGLLKGNGVEVIPGRARLLPSRQVEVIGDDGEKQVFQAQKIIIATGARPITLPIPGADSPKGIINAENVLDLEEVPESLLMIGGGVIGVEMATILAKLGSKVTVVEMLPHILPLEDEEMTAAVSKALQSDGVEIYENARVSAIEDKASGKTVTVATADGEKKLETKMVAIGVGYRPDTDGLGLEEAGITVEKGAIKVNESMATSVPGVYAAGDATGGIMLAYVAMEEGVVAAENALGKEAAMDYQVVPRCVFTLPELAGVGLTEAESREQGYDVQVGKFPFAANGMAVIKGERRGQVKIITDRKYGQILGVHIVGPQATELIAEAVLAMKLDLTPEEIIATIHSHPSLSEAFREAALDVNGETIHFLPSKR